MDFIFQLIDKMATSSISHGDIILFIAICILFYKIYALNKTITTLSKSIIDLLGKISTMDSNIENLFKTLNTAVDALFKRYELIDKIHDKQIVFMDKLFDEFHDYNTRISERLDNVDDDMKEIKKMLIVQKA